MAISDWSTDVCSSDLRALPDPLVPLQIADQPPLQRGHAAVARARVERAAKQPRGVVQQNADRFVHGRAYNRSDERSGGKECVSMCRYRWSLYNSKKTRY